MVKYITIDGEKHPIRIGYSALKVLQKDHGKNEKDIKNLSGEGNSSQDLEMMEIILWKGLVSGYKAERKKLELVEEDVEFYLDDCMVEFTEVMKEFFPKKEEKEETPKKPKSKVKPLEGKKG